jgi:hypothetical protein
VNHDSCMENEEVIDDIIAEYLITGVLEYCPPDHPPHCISALGLVPKRTHPFHRLIVDLRPVNEFQAEWRTHMSGLAANALIFNPGAVAFTRDLKAAYLLSGLGSCFPGIHGAGQGEPKRMKAPEIRRRWIGCTPENCKGHCNKTTFGIRWRNQLYRFAAPCFGSKHGGNVLETLLAPVWRKLKSFGCNICCWVDDVICVVECRGGPLHDPATCGGESKCVHCQDTFMRAREVERLVDAEFEALGLLTSNKNEPPAQRGEFLGLVWDTVQGAFVLTQEKAEKLATAARQLLASTTVSPRECAQWRGKMQWYAVCIEGVRILTRHLTTWIGNPGRDGWDKAAGLSPEAKEELQFWADHLPAMAGQLKPMWTILPAERLRRFREGQRSVAACLSVDASVLGWGAILEERSETGATIRSETSGRWAHDDPASEQAHREACGALRAFETFAVQLQGKTVLHLTDCTPVQAAVGSGSKNSKVIHGLVLQLWKLAAKWSIHIESVWIAGTDMLASGVDELSRELAMDKHDVRVSDDAWELALLLARDGGIELNVDLFADSVNTKLRLFWARDIAHGVCGRDALTAPSWGRCSCKRCGRHHDQGLWVFPPVPLLSRVISKLKGDGAHGVALVPFRPDVAW